jgi:hypothetical protein
MSKVRKTRYSEDNARFFNNESGVSNDPVFNLKIPDSKKTKDWYINYMEHVVPSHDSTINNYAESKLTYEIYNGDLSGLQANLDWFCNPLGEDEVAKIEEQPLAYPILHNKVNVLAGEYLKRSDSMKVMLMSDKAIKEKNKAMIEALKASIDEEIVLELEKIEAEAQGMKPTQIEQLMQELRTQATPQDIMAKDFLPEWEIFYNKVLKFCKVDQDAKLKGMDTLIDMILDDKFFVYSGWKNGKPHLEVRNTLYTGYHKDSNERLIHKGDYIWYKKPLTPAQVWEGYSDYLSDRDIMDLGLDTYARNHRPDSRHSVAEGIARPVFDTLDTDLAVSLVNGPGEGYGDKKVGLAQDNSTNTSIGGDSLVWETHFEFKAYKPVIYLSYKDEMGKTITVMMSDKIKIPRGAEKVEFTNRFGNKSIKKVWEEDGRQYEAETIWIPRKYEIIRLGDGVYPICREVPFQNTNLERPYSTFSLSTKGGVFTARNAKSISLFQRAVPFYLQYIYVKHIQNRELAKYQGYIMDIDVDQIPDELGKDINGDLIKDPIAVWSLYTKRRGINFYSGSQTGISGLTNPTRSPGSNSNILSTAADIFNLQQLAEMLDREMGQAMGISPQREAQFSSSSNVSDNQQAITQSHHITEPYFYYHSLIWRDIYQDYLLNFRTYAEKILLKDKQDHYLHYILPDGSAELLHITPKSLQFIDIGLYVTNSGGDQQYKELMLQLAHSFGQNAGEGMEAVSALLKGITSGMSAEEIHKMIKVESGKQLERMQAQQQAADQAQQKIEAMQKEFREDDQAHEIELAHIKGNYDLQKAAITQHIGQEDKDLDKDGIPDAVEIMKEQNHVQIKAKELAQKDRELDMKDKEMSINKELKEQEMKAKNAQKPKESK